MSEKLQRQRKKRKKALVGERVLGIRFFIRFQFFFFFGCNWMLSTCVCRTSGSNKRRQQMLHACCTCRCCSKRWLQRQQRGGSNGCCSGKLQLKCSQKVNDTNEKIQTTLKWHFSFIFGVVVGGGCGASRGVMGSPSPGFCAIMQIFCRSPFFLEEIILYMQNEQKCEKLSPLMMMPHRYASRSAHDSIHLRSARTTPPRRPHNPAHLARARAFPEK